jgi:predicted ATPase
MAVRPDFTVTADTAPAIAEIVARLDGLPLAIELAAAKTKLLGPEAILGRPGSRLAFLAGGPRDLPARQRTLRQAIDWSFTLLPTGLQALLPRLGVFVGGWTLEAAEAVARPGELGLEALDAMGSLVDQSLVRREEASHGEPRFTLLETIREFAVERLAGPGIDELRQRHAAYFLGVAEGTEPELTRSPEAGDRIEHDHDNFRAALAWSIERSDPELGLRLGFALWRFWQQRAHLREGRDWFDRLLAVPGADGRTAWRAKGLTGAAGVAYWQNDYVAAEAWYLEAEEIVRELGDRAWLTDAVYNSGSMAGLRGDLATVAVKFDEGKRIARELNDDVIVARFLEGEGYMAFMSDDLARARPLLEESLAIAQRRGDRLAMALAHHTVGQVARLDGRFADAAEHYREALRYGHQLGDEASLTEPLQGLAAVAIATHHPERGVRLLGANDAIRKRVGGGPPPEWLRLGDPLGEARQVLDEEAYREAWDAGLVMSVDDAVREALAES